MKIEDQIHVSLIQLERDLIVLPKSAILEVLPIDSVRPVEERIAPIWLAGWCQYGEQRLPVIRFEVLNGGAVPPAESRRHRVVVLDCGGYRLALMVHGYPHLASLNRQAVEPLALYDTDRRDKILARVRVARHDGLIPDLDALIEEASAISSPSALSGLR